MCNATPNQIPILNTINLCSILDIQNFLKLHGFELSCMLRYGINSDKLNALDIDLVKSHVNQEGITQDTLANAGMHRSRIDEIFGIPNPTPPPPVDEPEPQPIFTQAPNVSIRASLIDRVKRKKISVQEIQLSLLDGDISESDLIDSCELTERMVERIKGYRRHGMDPIEFDALPPLKTDCTDFYFLGLPSAGKSCLIASLLSHWLRSGICSQGVSNPRSIQYFKQLGGGFSKGILPDSTASSFIDYIELTLKLRLTEKTLLGGKREKNYDIPINVLDMAGEKFRQVADMGQEKFQEHKKYLSNNNPKSIFFVLDYSVDNHGESTFEQSFNLQVVLNNLNAMGVLEDTDSIYVVVTKADMFPVSPDKYTEFANNYLNEHYKSFQNTIDDLSKEHGFDYEVLPYSIGPCVFGQLLEEFNPNTNQNLQIYPEILSERIIKTTAKFKKGLGGLFSN